MRMNRIDKKFAELRARKKKAFIAFITAGDPSLAVTRALVMAFEKAGVDIVELGVPFSDPLADGPTIQAASQRALRNKVTARAIVNTVSAIRRHSQIPIALMTYYNPVLRFGEKRFVEQARRAGVDGLIIPDLPPEEASTLIRAARRHDIATIFFLSPTTARARIKTIARASTGFIYYVSLTGVTGARRKLPASLLSNVRLARRYTEKPVCVGFGISQPHQVRAVSRVADGVIVGSAIVGRIAAHTGKKKLVENVTRFVKRLASNV